ncbi:MAG: hypothetical protein HC814_04530 [Rhodobacteraceae bacterium]|nr:hypothetical protein [Paracoccaceae bacterium]
MSAPLPEALRARFQRLIEEGLSGRAAALRLKLSPATGARWSLSIRRTGKARAAPQGRPKGKGKLDPHRAFFSEIIAQDGDITMPELASALQEATGVGAHPNAPTRTRSARSFASSVIRTKKSPPLGRFGCAKSPAGQREAAERRRSRIRRQREDWFGRRIPAVTAQPERVVFIDETSVKTNLEVARFI